jgi:hypothetical protein
MDAMDFPSALALFSIDALAPEDMPEVAAEALADGFDSPSLSTLAGLSPFDARLARDLFLSAMEELGETMPPPEDGLRVRLRNLEERVRIGSLAPNEASELAWATYAQSPVLGREPMTLPADLRSVYALMDLAERWHEQPRDRRKLDSEIRAWFEFASGRSLHRPS